MATYAPADRSTVRQTTTICRGSIADYNECVKCAEKSPACKECKLAVKLVIHKGAEALAHKEILVIRFVNKNQDTFHVDAMAKVNGKAKVWELGYLYKRGTPRPAPAHAAAGSPPAQTQPVPAQAQTTPAIAAPASPASNLPFSYIPIQHGVTGHTASQQSWNLAKKWLANCVEKHKCSAASPENTVLPTRVLDLGPHDVVTTRVRLHESGGSAGVYACLSHRWGDSQPRKTTRGTPSTPGTLLEHRTGIEVSVLPRTFRDAVKMTRYLGIRYLWIDSLCIIQDDPVDWAQEAAKMAEIYQNARVTLAATISDGAESGLFHHTADAEDEQVSNALHDHDYTGIFIANPNRGKQYHGLQNDPELLKRAWVMQERFLSARFLHFAHELVFECREARVCECSEDKSRLWPETLANKRNCDETGLRKMSERPTAEARLKALYGQWYFIVGHYSTLQITYDSDILPALSGLVRVFQKFLPSDMIAGLWANEALFNELTWMVRAPKSSNRRSGGTERNISKVATFSWASVQLSKPSEEEVKDYPRQPQTQPGPNTDWGLRWIERQRDTESTGKDKQYKCDIVSKRTVLLEPSDPFGKIREAEIRLRGYLYPTKLVGLRELESDYEPPLAAHDSKYFYPDFNLLDNGVPAGTELYCFMLKSYDRKPVTEGTGSEAGRKRAEELARHGGPARITPEDRRDANYQAKHGSSYALSLVLKKIKDLPGEAIAGEFERVGIMEFEGGAVHGNEPPGRRDGVSWVEEIREKTTAHDSNVLAGVVVKII